ncbi:hypothetical protein TRAPUB_3353 [Trametes pubescens]|uniref:Uncharacterized protein n=1 Tax=Trametes pubescens TaxID=154538 RepID=A0A1M2VDX1_TRAPU|nr:hypothetical protein TRAPUB_3353 [Trametes pubescens]
MAGIAPCMAQGVNIDRHALRWHLNDGMGGETAGKSEEPCKGKGQGGQLENGCPARGRAAREQQGAGPMG